jgi:hypothetical protein
MHNIVNAQHLLCSDCEEDFSLGEGYIINYTAHIS